MISPSLFYSRFLFAKLSRLLAGTALFLFALFNGLTGCSNNPDSLVLAKVGDHNITVTELNDYSRDITFDNATLEQEISGKKQLLDSLVFQRLLIQGAYARGIQNVEEVNRAVLSSRNQFLVDILYQERIRSKISITGKDLRDYWEKLADVVRVQQIISSTLDSAEMIIARLRNGENFEQLAYDLSIDPTAKRTRGDLGLLEWGALSSELQAAVFSMKTNEISPPIKSKAGYYHIARVLERRPNAKRRELSAMRDELYNSLLNIRSNQLAEEFFAELRKKYILAIDTETVRYLVMKRNNLYPPQILASLPKSTFDVKQLDRNEKELKLASWSGGQVSVGQYLTLADESGVPAEFRPDLEQYDSLASFIFDLKRTDFFVQEALSTGLDKHPDFQRRLRLLKELTMAEIMRNDSLTVGLVVTDQMARDFYDKNAGNYKRGERIRLFEIQTSDQSLAARLAREIKSLEEFSARAIQYTERPTRRGTNGDLGYIEERNIPELFAIARETSIGDIGGPIPVEGKFSIFYVIDKTPEETVDYLGVKRDIVTMLVDTLRVQTARNWADQQRAAIKIEYFEENLRKSILARREKYEAERAI